MNDPVENTVQEGFSIIVPVYNGEKTLPDTLQSLFNLDGEPYEVIVVDDASTDKTPQLARDAGAKVIQLQTNSGPATARNEGARHTQYSILLFTDSDVLVLKPLLNQLKTRFDESGADAVQGTFSSVCPYANYISQYKNLYNRYVLNQLPDWIDTTFTSITAVRRTAFHECGGFDENIRDASIEDRTLGRNLIKHGFRIRLDRSLEVIHNKKLTFRGFIRNQFRRSRDLAKFLLRNRSEPDSGESQENGSIGESGRFGTNAPSTMVRIPVVYAMLFFGALSFVQSIFLVVTAAFGLMFLYLIKSFEWYLVKKRSLSFALKGIPLNWIDAFISGFGVLLGIIEFMVFGRKY